MECYQEAENTVDISIKKEYKYNKLVIYKIPIRAIRTKLNKTDLSSPVNYWFQRIHTSSNRGSY
jgi:hypothetical protein